MGSGERAEYGVGQIVQLVVAFELLRHRMPPAVIAEVVRTEWPTVAVAFASAARTITGRGETEDGWAKRVMLVLDATGLHEAGKTVRRGELLTTIEVIAADEVLGARGAAWRSALLIDPSAIVADIAAVVPTLKRSMESREFLAAIASLAEVAAEAIGRPMSIPATTDDRDWSETGYSRRRALSDALAVLRAADSLPRGDERPLSPGAAARLAAALGAKGRPLSDVAVGEWTLDAALRVYLHWIGVSGDKSQQPTAAEILMITTRAQAPQHLHEAMIDAILGEIGTPVQDM